MAVEGELAPFGLALDKSVEICVAELGDPPAHPADEMMMVIAARELITNAPVFERHATDEIKLLEEPDSPKDGGPSHLGHSKREVFCRERMGRGRGNGLQDRAPRRRSPVTDLFQLDRSRGNEIGHQETIVGRSLDASQRVRSAPTQRPSPICSS